MGVVTHRYVYSICNNEFVIQTREWDKQRGLENYCRWLYDKGC